MMLKMTIADTIIDGALAEAKARNAKPLGIIVLDAGGTPVMYRRQDGASLFRFDIARAKAMGALGMGADSSEIAARASKNPAFFTTVAIATGGSLALSAGGVLIRFDDQIVGAIGISGDTPETDEACAKAGVASVESQGGGK